jgi:hypothetical protein
MQPQHGYAPCAAAQEKLHFPFLLPDSPWTPVRPSPVQSMPTSLKRLSKILTIKKEKKGKGEKKTQSKLLRCPLPRICLRLDTRSPLALPERFRLISSRTVVMI